MSNETVRHLANVFPVSPEALKPERKLPRTGSIIKEFSLNTSTHGIPGIARSKSIPNCVFWSISLLIFTGIMLYFVIQAIQDYFQYPTQTSVSIIVEWPQVFPAVTLCNYSPLRYDRFIGPFLNYTNAHNLTNTTSTVNFTLTQSMYIREFLTYKLNQGESLNDFFFSLESMLIQCNFNGIPCSASNFTWFVSAIYGLCYTFNAQPKDTTNSTLRYNADNGASGSFQVSLYVHHHQYVPYMSNGIGMIVLVHDNTQLPEIELAGMQLAPGRHHKLSYTKKTSFFLSAPYTNCTDQVNLGMRAIFDQYHGTEYGYDQYECFQACIQAYTYAQCDCGNPYRWNARSVMLPGATEPVNISFCSMNNTCYSAAGAKLMNTPSLWDTYCPGCAQECSFSDFVITSSSLLAPPVFLLNDIKRFVDLSTVPVPADWSTSWVSNIQSSFVALEVDYETTRTEIYSQQATIGKVDLVSNVGGQTGLWIGVSFLSLMELAEMIFRLIRYQCHRLRKGTRKRFRRRNTTEPN